MNPRGLPGRQGGSAIAVRLTVLGSGSGGNAALLTHRDAHVLIDAGLSCRDVCRRLEAVGVDPTALRGIVITHAHGDHTRGARLLSQRYELPVYSTAATRREWQVDGLADWRELVPPRPVDLCGLRFRPCVVPHDASETVAFHIDTPAGAVGYATDIGVMTAELAALFSDCRLLVIESNHAVDLLRVSPYDAATRSRIAGEGGHLSNEALAEFIRGDLGPDVRCIVLMHLSRVNNVPALAELTAREALEASGRGDVQVVVTYQDRVAAAVDLETC